MVTQDANRSVAGSASPSTRTAPAVRVEGLRKSFGDVEVIGGIDFQIERGDFVTLLGPSGCGKSTTLRLIAGLEKATAGVIELFGERVVDVEARISVAPSRRPISMVFQSYALWPHLTALRNVMFPLANRKTRGESKALGRGRAWARERAMEVLRLVKCDHLAERYPGEMSGGQQQRIALARALAMSPPLILLDEPLSNLDAALRRELRFELRQLQEDLGFTAIYVTHDQVEALSMSDRIILMNNGLIEQEASPPGLFHRPRSAYAAGFIGDNNLLPGTVVADHGDGSLVVGTPIGEFPAVSAERGRATPVGSTGTVVLRTDRLRARVAEAGGVGQVLGVAFCGAFVDIAVTTKDGREVIAREYVEEAPVHRGDSVRLEVIGEALFAAI